MWCLLHNSQRRCVHENMYNKPSGGEVSRLQTCPLHYAAPSAPGAVDLGQQTRPRRPCLKPLRGVLGTLTREVPAALRGRPQPTSLAVSLTAPSAAPSTTEAPDYECFAAWIVVFRTPVAESSALLSVSCLPLPSK